MVLPNCENDNRQASNFDAFGTDFDPFYSASAQQPSFGAGSSGSSGHGGHNRYIIYEEEGLIGILFMRKTKSSFVHISYMGGGQETWGGGQDPYFIYVKSTREHDN